MLPFSWWNLLWISFIYFLFAGLGVAVGYHKYFSHKSFETYRAIEKLLAIFGLMSMAGSVLFWTCYHRGVHHKHSESDLDLSSPRHGYLKSFLLWHNDITEKTINLAYGRDILKDPFLMFLHRNQFKVFWGICGIVGLISPYFLFTCFLPAIVLSHHQDNAINLFSHLPAIGYRNFQTDDDSNNSLLLGWLFWGQGWHNNHHANPSRLNYGVKWWELDTAFLISKLLEKKK